MRKVVVVLTLETHLLNDDELTTEIEHILANDINTYLDNVEVKSIEEEK